MGHPEAHPRREIVDAIRYLVDNGCKWRALPSDFPPWKTVYDWFRRWRIDGTWERLNAELRELLRVRLGRDPDPSAAIVDSQTTRTTGVGGTERGFDPAKNVEGILSATCSSTPRVWCSKPCRTQRRSSRRRWNQAAV